MSCYHRNKQQTSVIVNESAHSNKEKTTEISYAKIVQSTSTETKLAAKPQVNQR